MEIPNQTITEKPAAKLVTDHQLKLDKIAKAYTSEPWWYDLRGFMILTFAYRSTLPAQLRLFANNMGPRHLEAAIGTGTLFDLILKWRALTRKAESKTIGFDYAPRMLGGAIRRFRKQKNLILELGDVTELNYESNSFDTANVANALHCFPDIQKGMTELHRVLKPGGTLAGNVLLYPKGQNFLDRIATRINNWGKAKGILYTPYHRKDIEVLLNNIGFELTLNEVSGNCHCFVARKKLKEQL